jgi:hypothetical protein
MSVTRTQRDAPRHPRGKCCKTASGQDHVFAHTELNRSFCPSESPHNDRLLRTVQGFSADAQWVIGGRQAAPGLQVEAPAVQRARQHAVLDLSEHRQVGVAMGAAPLHDPVAELDVRLDLGGRVQPADRPASVRRIRSVDSDLKKL